MTVDKDPYEEASFLPYFLYLKPTATPLEIKEMFERHERITTAVWVLHNPLAILEIVLLVGIDEYWPGLVRLRIKVLQQILTLKELSSKYINKIELDYFIEALKKYRLANKTHS